MYPTLSSRPAYAAAFLLVGILSVSLAPDGALAAGPRCPAAGAAAMPSYAATGKPPSVGVWRDVAPETAPFCLDKTRGKVSLAVALAGCFSHAGSIGDIARLFGAVSATKGIKYWSTTDAEWRPLVSDAVALKSPDAKSTRSDFTASEVLSGRPLYFAQDDTRSSGLNVYRLTARSTGPNRLVVEIVNLSPIRLWFVTLFAPETLVSVHFIDRLAPGVWGYYGLTAVYDGAREGSERSFINRAAVYHRLVTGIPSDKDPPLAR